MEVHFTPEQEAQIAKLAASAGTDPEALVKDAAIRLLDENAQHHGDALRGKDYAKRSEFAEEEKARSEQPPRSPQEAAERIREIQKRTKPDPEGWTVSDYINYGRP